MERGNVKISSHRFYNNYKGHDVKDLEMMRNYFLEKNGKQKFIYLAGDSSLDNKYWIKQNIEYAVNGYDDILEPPKSICDICYHMNNQTNEYVTINCAVEESTLAERKYGRLLSQDNFIKENIRENDVLIVSVGGNDIALKPSLSTIWNLLLLMKLQLNIQ